MPARQYIVAIVAFWLATCGWLFYRELWPRLRPGAPPPFTIDQVDEARQQSIHWTIFQAEPGHQGLPKEIGRVDTEVKYRERGETYRRERGERFVPRDEAVDRPRDDTYEHWCKVKLFNLLGADLQLVVEDTYRYTRGGDLLEISADVSIDLMNMKRQGVNVSTDRLKKDGKPSAGREEIFRAHLEGPVADGQLVLEGWSERPAEGGQRLRHALTTQPVPVPGRSSVLNQLNPANRMPDLSPGQHWDIRPFDPLRAALSDAHSDDLSIVGPVLFLLKQFGPANSAQPSKLQAEVLEERETLHWDGRDESCLVVEYRNGAEPVARTWVRARDGLVLQQEATYLDKRVLLKRVPSK
jgi:hypothetical protein